MKTTGYPELLFLLTAKSGEYIVKSLYKRVHDSRAAEEV